MKKIALILALLGLSACGSIHNARDEDTCTNMGAPAGSANYYDCRKMLHEEREERHQRIAQALRDLGKSIQVQQPQQVEVHTAPMNCTSNMIGNTLQTQCF